MITVRKIQATSEVSEISEQEFLTLNLSEQSSAWYWVDMNNASEQQALTIYQKLSIHPLAVQDISRDRHPSKYESFGDIHLFLMKGLARQDELDGLYFEPIQIGMLLGKHFVVTRHKGSPSIERIAENGNFSTPEVLIFDLFRMMYSRYLNWMLKHEENFQEAETKLLEQTSDETLDELVSSKKELRKLHRNFNYMAEMFKTLESLGLNERYPPHCSDLHDLYEKFERICSMSLMYYDQTGDLIEGFISMSSHRLNRTMQILTVITAIFVPLTFLAGIYGMNFEVMPELKLQNGYFILLGVMLLMALGLIVLFRKFKWF